MQVKNSTSKKRIKRKKCNNKRNKYIFQLCQVNDKLERKVGKVKELLKGQVQL